MVNNNYDDMTLVELRKIAKDNNIKNISKLKKAELIEAIKSLESSNTNQVSIERNGVVLKEKITPKSSNEEISTRNESETKVQVDNHDK